MPRTVEEYVRVSAGDVSLDGILTVPEGAKRVVIFAHGSGSSRLSPRNAFVAGILQAAGFGTFLFDLLTGEEDFSFTNRFDIDLLTRRLMGATRWLAGRPEGQGMKFGYFGASTGAAAALQGAAQMGETIRAIVSRGGRPDLAMAYLPKVHAPTLLIVGELDHEVLQLNRQAYAQLAAEKELAIVPGATHLFEEEGTLAEVAQLAREWFLRQLA